MTPVILESPFSGDREKNIEYARKCMLDCLKRNEAPYASHLLYTQCLDDSDPEERKLGIEAGFVWGELAEKIVIYTDIGLSEGMKLGIRNHISKGKTIEYRTLAEVTNSWYSE